jgi:serine/threonine protein kinase
MAHQWSAVGFSQLSQFLKMREQMTVVGDYLLSYTFGEGATAKVKLAIHRVTGEQVAMKIITKTSFADRPDAADQPSEHSTSDRCP